MKGVIEGIVSSRMWLKVLSFCKYLPEGIVSTGHGTNGAFTSLCYSMDDRRESLNTGTGRALLLMTSDTK
jgi:hypothetical protein